MLSFLFSLCLLWLFSQQISSLVVIPHCHFIITSCVISHILLNPCTDYNGAPAQHTRTSSGKTGTATESNRPQARMPIIPQEREIRQVFHFYSIDIELRQKRGACEVVTDTDKNKESCWLPILEKHPEGCIFSVYFVWQFMAMSVIILWGR